MKSIFAAIAFVVATIILGLLEYVVIEQIRQAAAVNSFWEIMGWSLVSSAIIGSILISTWCAIRYLNIWHLEYKIKLTVKYFDDHRIGPLNIPCDSEVIVNALLHQRGMLIADRQPYDKDSGYFNCTKISLSF